MMVIMTSCPGHGLVSYTQSSQSTTTESLALPPKGLSSGRQRLMALFLCQGPRFVSPSNSFFMIMIIILAFYLLDQEWRTKVEANTGIPWSIWGCCRKVPPWKYGSDLNFPITGAESHYFMVLINEIQWSIYHAHTKLGWVMWRNGSRMQPLWSTWTMEPQFRLKGSFQSFGLYIPVWSHTIYIIYNYITRVGNPWDLPVVPHKAVAEVSKIGNL
jgi:hypothetical protein